MLYTKYNSDVASICPYLSAYIRPYLYRKGHRLPTYSKRVYYGRMVHMSRREIVFILLIMILVRYSLSPPDEPSPTPSELVAVSSTIPHRIPSVSSVSCR